MIFFIFTDGNNLGAPSTVSACSHTEYPNLLTPCISTDHLNIPQDSVVITMQPDIQKLLVHPEEIPGPESNI